ncbi:M48 family metallopeptidase [Methylocystis bryophila]|uniref:Metalloendopeptidase n=1 Tax=Methylocystis bryophila TaxID=655015 RepID=A0A1W6MV91_9HYPH|nr:M48 family metallopeptidase [Methylocystis bryophila]ARN81511.1 metalloendopeptidase [Methylocystis bryophila]BDV37531.1 metalloendopeptidase [Methylocystis bryophila]
MSDAPPPPEATRAIYFDGVVNKKRAVTLVFGEDALEIVAEGARVAAWPYAEMRRAPAGDDALRLRATSAPELARLQLSDPDAKIRLAALCPALDGADPGDVSSRKIVLWSLAAVGSILGLLFFGVPYAADVIADHIPLALEQRLGRVAENQLRAIVPGARCTAPSGVAALRKLSEKLQAAADLRMPANIVAYSSKTPNAFALPGGSVFLLSGLLAKAQNQDEVVGVLAHELGHLQHRDHVRRMIANGGGAYLIGLLFGDVTGGGALVFAGKELFFASHSRETEAAADAFAAQALARLGRPAKPLGELLLRITGPEENGAFTILHDHPLSEERLQALAAQDKGARSPPLLSDEEWSALKGICAGRGKAAFENDLAAASLILAKLGARQ